MAVTRDIPGVGRQYLYRLPAEAGGGVAWLSDATRGAPTTGFQCADGVVRTAYRCHAAPGQPGRPRRIEVLASAAELAELDALAAAWDVRRPEAIRLAVHDALVRIAVDAGGGAIALSDAELAMRGGNMKVCSPCDERVALAHTKDLVLTADPDPDAEGAHVMCASLASGHYGFIAYVRYCPLCGGALNAADPAEE